MPYPGVPDSKTEAMERCVSSVMAKGKDKSSAIAICKTSIMGNATLALEAATEDDILKLQAELGDWVDVFAAKSDLPGNAILKFEGARLAKAEINRNRDGISTEGIKQLAETIRLMPITYEHEKQPRGVFTRGYTDEDSTECLVDGFLWAGMFPVFAEEIRNGIRKLSIDAEADLAVCGECGQVCQSAAEYCEHLRAREAVRWLFDLRAVAGGAVLNPAGTDTVFPGKDGMVVISHKLGASASVDVKAEWWEKYWSKRSEIPSWAFADPKGRRYPYKNPQRKPDKEGWMAAWKRAHQQHEEKIISILKRNLPKGYKLQDGSVVRASGGASMKIVCDECGHEQEITTDAEKLQAELEEKLKELEEAQTKVESLEASLAESQDGLEAEKKVTERFADLVATVGIEAAQEALPSLRKVDDEVFEIMKSMASRSVDQEDEEEEQEEADPEPAPAPQTFSAADDDPPDVGGDTWNLEV